MSNKQRLFEVMGRLDKTFKPKLNEEKYQSSLPPDNWLPDGWSADLHSGEIYYDQNGGKHTYTDLVDKWNEKNQSNFSGLNENTKSENLEIQNILAQNGWKIGEDYFKEGKNAYGDGSSDAYGFWDKAVIEKLGSKGNYSGDLDTFLNSIGLEPINIWVGSAVYGWTHRLVRLKKPVLNTDTGVNEIFGFSQKEKDDKALKADIENLKKEILNFHWTNILFQPRRATRPDEISAMLNKRLQSDSRYYPTLYRLLPNLFNSNGYVSAIWTANGGVTHRDFVIPSTFSFAKDAEGRVLDNPETNQRILGNIMQMLRNKYGSDIK